MRLIDADALSTKVIFVCEDGYYGADMVLKKDIDNAPTIEAEPVKHGRWEYIADFGDGNCYGHCSNCKTQHKAKNPTALKLEYRYCRWCGAKMDGGAENEN